MKIIKNIKHFVVFFVIQLSFIEQEAICMDAAFANDTHYRSGSWERAVMTDATHLLHQKLAYSVVCAHELCEDPSSNIAALGFSIHKGDGTVLKSVEFPLLFSSGKLAPLLPSSLNVCTIDERFSKTLDILSPRQQLVEYINFIRETLGLAFSDLDRVSLSLTDGTRLDRSPSIPILRLESGDLDVPLGYVKHCEQCFIHELFRNLTLLERSLRTLSEAIIEESLFISLNILTYNDMCQRCFAACDRFLPILQNTVQRILPSVIVPAHIYISSFRPFEININKDTSCGFTRGRRKCGDYESFIQTPHFTGDDSKIVRHRTQIFQFFNQWMLDAQRDIERKKCIRAAIQALSDNVPLIFEDLPTVLSIRRNAKQLSLANALGAIESLQRIQGETSAMTCEEIQKIQPLVNAAHIALTVPLVEQKNELDTRKQSITQILQTFE